MSEGLFQSFSDRGVDLRGSRIVIIGAGGVAGAVMQGRSRTRSGTHYDSQQNAGSGGKTLRGSGICVCRGSDPGKYERRGEGCGRHHKLHFSGNVRYRCGFYRFIVLDGTAALLCDLIYNPWETKFLAYGRQRTGNDERDGDADLSGGCLL